MIKLDYLLCRDPRYPSLNFEALGGHPDCFTIRLNRYWRIHLRKIPDEHYQVFSVESHDAYKAKALKSHSKRKIH